jgi:hypothetical protein
MTSRDRTRGQSTVGAPALSPERAFVVQFREGSHTEAEPWAGRVEHVRTGEARRFESREELLAFIARLLATRQEQR